MKRLALYVLLALAAVAVVLASFAGWVLATEPGARFAVRHGRALVSYDIELDSLEGRLLGPLVVRGLAVRGAGIEIELEHGLLEWRPLALLGGALDVERVELTGLDVTPGPEADAPEDGASGTPASDALDPAVDVRLGRLTIADLRYHRASGETVVVEDLHVAGHWNDSELLVSALEARGPGFELGGRARVLPAAPHRIEATFDWRLAPPGYAEVVGSTDVTGNLDMLVVEQRVEAPYGVEGRMQIARPLSARMLSGRLDVDLDVAAVADELPDATLTAAVRVDGPADSLEVAADAELDAAGVEPLDVMLRAALGGDRLAIDRLEVVQAASGAEIRASGRVAFGGGAPRGDLDGTWTGLRWPLTGEPRLTSDSGSFAVSGRLDEYDVTVEAAIATPRVPEARGRLHVEGGGDGDALRLSRVELEALRGRVTGTVELGFEPLGAELELTASGIDPRGLAERWPGQLDGRLDVSAGFDGEVPVVRVDELVLDGRLRERRVDLTARGAYADRELRLDSLSLALGSTSLEADGTVGERAAVNVAVDSGDLGDLWPGASGTLTLDGRVRGPRTWPQVTVQASAGDVDVSTVRIGRFELDADVDVAGERRSELTATIGEAVVAGTEIHTAALEGDGNAARHTLGLSFSTGLGGGRLRLTGRVERPWEPDAAWRFDLPTARLEPAALAAWELRSASGGRVSAAGARLAETCWQSGDATLCLEAERAPERTRAAWSLSALPLSYLGALLEAAPRLEGTLRADGELVATADAPPRGNLTLRSTRGRLVTGEDGAGVAFGPIEAELTADAERIAASLNVPFASGGEIDADARVDAGPPGEAFAERRVEGRLRARLDDLAVVSGLTARVEEMRGNVDGELELSGTVGAPRVRGALALENASARLPDPNIRIEDASLEARGDGTSLMVRAHARSGDGAVDAEGRLRLTPAGPQGELSATGERFQIVDTLELGLLVSPDLRLVLDAERMELTGSLTVPQGRIESEVAGEDVVAVSADEVVVGAEEETAAAEALPPLHATVMLRLGDDVRIDAMGLEGRLAGAVQVEEAPEEPATASGELRVENGTYEAYGQTLEIRTGRLLFAGGPVERPGLDIEAVRQPAEDVLVGARVRGTLAQPELSLFSEPPMQQREQLSYLVLGRSLQRTSSAEESAVSRAALALGLRGGNFVSERLNTRLGLDEFGIQARPGEPASAASFVIGKYLSPSLYVSYGIGLFEPVSTLQLRYDITRRWRLVTESSEEGSGGDIIYNLERSSR